MSVDAQSPSASGQPENKTVTVVGVGQRLIAIALDGVILGLLSFLAGALVGVVVMLLDMYTPNQVIPINQYLYVAGFALSIAYFAGSWVKSGQTIGGMLMDFKVVGANGKPVSWGRALLRYVGYIVSAVCLSLGFLWAAFDRKRQGWHDKLAGTYVVRGDSRFDDAQAVTFVPSDPERSWIWLVVWIVLILIAPGALVAALWLLGPFVSTFVTNLIRGLFG